MKMLFPSLAVIAMLAAGPTLAQTAIDAVTKAATEAATEAAAKAATDTVNETLGIKAKGDGTPAKDKTVKKAKKDKDGPNLGKSEEHRQDAGHRKKPKK